LRRHNDLLAVLLLVHGRVVVLVVFFLDGPRDGTKHGDNVGVGGGLCGSESFEFVFSFLLVPFALVFALATRGGSVASGCSGVARFCAVAVAAAATVVFAASSSSSSSSSSSIRSSSSSRVVLVFGVGGVRHRDRSIGRYTR